VQDLIDIAPVLGAYDRVQSTFGIPRTSRYARRMTGKDLDWQDEERGGATILAPTGRVDETTADSFKNHLIEAVEKEPSVLVVDLGGVAYMSSRGLRALTLAQRAAQGSQTNIVLARPNDTMREILAISRYDMVFRVADTVEEAIAN